MKGVLVVAIPWCAGFFMGGGAVVEKSLDDEVPSSALHPPALSAEVQGPGEEGDAVPPAERRERVLAGLVAAMRQLDEVRRMRRDAAAVANIGPEDIQAALELVLKEDPERQFGLVPQIVARWADFDPKAAADYALTLKPGDYWSRESLLACLTTQWAEKDPAAAKAWALAMPAGKEQAAALDGLIGEMLQADPAAAMAWLKSLPDDLRPEGAYYKILEKLAGTDPVIASQQALAMPPGEDREHALTVVATHSAAKDPQGALSLMQQVSGSLPGYYEAVTAVFEGLAENNLESAMTAATSMPEGSGRDHALGVVISKAAQAGESEIARLLAQISDESLRTETVRAAAGILVFSDSQLAKKVALMLPAGKSQDECVVNVAQRIPPADALAFIGSNLSDTAARQEAMDETVKKWSLTDPHDAVMWMVKSPGTNKELLNYVIDQWAHEDPVAALGLANSEPDGERKQTMLSGAIKGLSSNDPMQAAELLATIPAGEARNDTAQRIAGAWAPYDPVGAAEWAVQLTDPASREAAMVRVTQAMVHTDIAGTAEWLERLRVGGERDASVAAFAESVTNIDPESAVVWAATVADPGKREDALGAVYRQWETHDQAAATRWLGATSALSEEAKQRIGAQ